MAVGLENTKVQACLSLLGSPFLCLGMFPKRRNIPWDVLGLTPPAVFPGLQTKMITNPLGQMLFLIGLLVHREIQIQIVFIYYIKSQSTECQPRASLKFR